MNPSDRPVQPSGRDELRELLRRERVWVWLSVLLMACTAIAGTALLGLSGGFLTATALAGALGAGSTFNFFSPSAGIRALTLARIVSRYFEKLVSHDTTLRLARELRVWFFRRALPLAPNPLGGQRLGDVLSRVMADIAEVDGLLVRAWGPLYALALLALATVVLAAWLYLPAAVLLLALALGLGWLVPALVHRQALQQEAARVAERGALRAVTLEGLDGLTDLTALRARRDWHQRVLDAAARMRMQDGVRRRRQLAGQAVHGAVASLAVVAMLALVLQAVGQQRLSAPHAAALVFLTIGLLEVLAGAGLAWQALHAARAAAGRLTELTDATPPVPDAAGPHVAPMTVRAAQTLSLRDVHFARPGQPALLRGVNLTLAPGERVAIHGDSGSGKSTLSELVLRLWDPDAGQICWGGTDLRAMTPRDWHAHLAWLPQQAPVFAGTVAENLRLGDPQADEARLWSVLAQVRLADWARAQQGLETWVGENGATLSAGQARRLALARALLRRAPLMLLDEPTEGLDVDTAEAVMRDLDAALGARSLLVITHAPLPPGLVQRELWLREGRLESA